MKTLEMSRRNCYIFSITKIVFGFLFFSGTWDFSSLLGSRCRFAKTQGDPGPAVLGRRGGWAGVDWLG